MVVQVVVVPVHPDHNLAVRGWQGKVMQGVLERLLSQGMVEAVVALDQ
jgi:hypothetical protein